MKIQRLLGRLAAACLFVSVVSGSASAQVRRQSTYASRPVYTPAAASSGVKFGLRAGLNVADVAGDAVTSFAGLTDFTDGAVTRESRPGFYAGLYATLPLGSSFALEPGLVYSEKGTVLQGTVPVAALDFLSTRLTGTARLAYLDIPVVAKAYLTKGFYLYAGPQASVLLSGQARAEASILGFSAYKQDFDIKSQLRTVDFGLVGGLGYQFDSGLGLSAGYDYGLSSLDSGNRFDAQNRVIKVGLTYAF